MLRSTMKCLLVISVVLVTFLSTVSPLNNGLARTPPMGWMQWERFRCETNCTEDPDNCIGEKLFKQIADAMVSEGYHAAGYQYLSIDDCWMLPERGPDGRLTPDPQRFPSGMKSLADYIHSKGLRLGIYADMGLHTCKLYPGSKFYLQLDAQTFADWGVDMLKLDCCWAGGLGDLETGYEVMSLYLNKSTTLTKRPILYACSWPACSGHATKYKLVRDHCNMWRNYADLRDSWDYVYRAIDYYGNNTDGFQQIAGPGGWNDPDQVVVGNFGLSEDQERAQFGMWCMMASPIFMSNDPRHMRLSSHALLTNKNLIAINQDSLGVQAYRIRKANGLETWLKPLSGSCTAIAVLNNLNYGNTLKFSATLGQLGLNNTSGYHLTEAFENKDMGKYLPKDSLKLFVNPTGIAIVVVSPVGDTPAVEVN
ncbi:alpha-galactosidase A-like isoform X2 [Mya arenaria]|uniref:alpha-galactosidase A-like isoform X2 n=1 Tax=Mya arenaria TaxID=6604 RepID=UPI0022E0004B|nr:alpha-galactosidase A-like isoform X2 [Mya arenaria]